MHPTTIYFSDKKIPYGNFYPINSENTILDLQYNEEEDYNYSVLYLNYESSQSTILYENENPKPFVDYFFSDWIFRMGWQQ